MFVNQLKLALCTMPLFIPSRRTKNFKACAEFTRTSACAGDEMVCCPLWTCQDHPRRWMTQSTFLHDVKYTAIERFSRNHYTHECGQRCTRWTPKYTLISWGVFYGFGSSWTWTLTRIPFGACRLAKWLFDFIVRIKNLQIGGLKLLCIVAH